MQFYTCCIWGQSPLGKRPERSGNEVADKRFKAVWNSEESICGEKRVRWRVSMITGKAWIVRSVEGVREAKRWKGKYHSSHWYDAWLQIVAFQWVVALQIEHSSRISERVDKVVPFPFRTKKTRLHTPKTKGQSKFLLVSTGVCLEIPHTLRPHSLMEEAIGRKPQSNNSGQTFPPSSFVPVKSKFATLL